jgi:hypothetical protein
LGSVRQILQATYDDSMSLADLGGGKLRAGFVF